jgi:signal transduction histidine kinase
MNLPILFGVLSVAVGATLAAESWPLARAPGLEDLRWFSIAAATASLSTVAALGSSLPIGETLVPWAGRVQLLLLGAHVATWWVYLSAYLERPLTARGLAVCWGAVLLGVASLVPGVAYGSGVRVHAVPWLGATYRSAEVSPTGAIVFAAIAAVPVILAVRLLAARRRGVPHAGMLAASFLAATALGVSDAVVVSLGLRLPYLLEFGHILPILVVAWANLSRHADEAVALYQLRQGLERAVAERTRDLVEAQAALLEAEKAAALGRYSARLAHDLSSPAAVVAANLRYVLEHLEKEVPLPADGLAALRESSEAMQRVVRIARRLTDAARTGSVSGEDEGTRGPGTGGVVK